MAAKGATLAAAEARVALSATALSVDMEKLIQQLEVAWDENGFFDHLRAGLFNPTEASDFMLILRSIDLDDQEMIPARLLALIWYIPSFLDWQRDRVAEKGGDVDGYARFITEVTNILEQVIGVP